MCTYQTFVFHFPGAFLFQLTIKQKCVLIRHLYFIFLEHSFLSLQLSKMCTYQTFVFHFPKAFLSQLTIKQKFVLIRHLYFIFREHSFLSFQLSKNVYLSDICVSFSGSFSFWAFNKAKMCTYQTFVFHFPGAFLSQLTIKQKCVLNRHLYFIFREHSFFSLQLSKNVYLSDICIWFSWSTPLSAYN
jgi:hypothetical protein